jgi:hypothetical protein
MSYDKYNIQPQVSKATLYKKMANVMGRLERVRKSGKHQQGYNYAKAEDINDAIRPAMAAEGLAMLFNVDKKEVELGKTSYGNPNVSVHLEITFTIACGESGATCNSTVFGSASDPGSSIPDKAFSKAYTKMEKDFLRLTFVMSSGDDIPDSDADDYTEDQPKTKSRTQQKPQPKPEKLPEWLDAFYLKAEMDYSLTNNQVDALLRLANLEPTDEAKKEDYQAVIDGQMETPTSKVALIYAANQKIGSRYYRAVEHVVNAMNKHTGKDNWTFPSDEADIDSWQVAFNNAVDYALTADK